MEDVPSIYGIGIRRNDCIMNVNIAKPVIKQIKDTRDALDFFETVSLPAEDEKTQEIIMNFPTVYIHNWQDSGYY